MNSNSDNDSPPVSSVPSGLLEVIPPAVRPHAHNMITIPFDDLAQLVMDSSEKLRMERAMLRAVKMVEREWVKVWKSMSQAKEAKQRGERRSERGLERRKRKAQESDIGCARQKHMRSEWRSMESPGFM